MFGVLSSFSIFTALVQTAEINGNLWLIISEHLAPRSHMFSSGGAGVQNQVELEPLAVQIHDSIEMLMLLCFFWMSN